MNPKNCFRESIHFPGFGSKLTNDGKTAIYAHLDHFTPKMNNLVNALHEYYGQYTINHDLEKYNSKYRNAEKAEKC